MQVYLVVETTLCLFVELLLVNTPLIPVAILAAQRKESFCKPSQIVLVVGVFKPIRGHDCFLEVMLRSFFCITWRCVWALICAVVETLNQCGLELVALIIVHQIFDDHPDKSSVASNPSYRRVQG